MGLYQRENGQEYANCFACGHFDPDPQVDTLTKNTATTVGGKKPQDIKTTLTVAQLDECPTHSISSRGIKHPTSEFYGVRTILNGYDGQTPVAIVFPYSKKINGSHKTVGYKKRVLDSKIFTAVGDMSDAKLFGQDKFLDGGKKLFITEGELDAMSLFQVFKDLSSPEYKHINPCVVSLPHGAKAAAKSLSNNMDFIQKFDEIVLVFDQDEAGQQAVSDACSFLPLDKTKIVTFSEKDANAMLLAGKQSELKWACISHAQSYQPEGVTTSRALLDAALSPSKKGPDWPWPSLTKLTYGRQPGIIGIGAGVGIGKTEFFHELIFHIVGKEKRPVGIFLLEEAPQRTYKILGGKSLNLPVHRPDVEYDQEELKKHMESFHTPRELLHFFDHKGSRDWDTIYSQCKYFATVHGVRDIILDPLTAIISGEENTDRALHRMMADIAVLAQAPYNCTIYYSSHLNEPPRDRIPHEEGGRVKEAHFAGSRAMIRFSNYIIALERNKQDPDVIQRNTTTVRILKDRDFGDATGETFEIFHDNKTGRYLEQHLEF